MTTATVAEDDGMEFLVEFKLSRPDGATEAEFTERSAAEAAAAARLADEGHLTRLWAPRDGAGGATAIGLYRAGSRAELDDLLSALPLYDWMDVSVTPLESHPNDPAGVAGPAAVNRLPDPRPSFVYRLEATLGRPLVVGDVAQGQRRIVPLTDGTFAGPELSGTLLPGASADWQIVLHDGTALGDIRYTLQTTRGDLLDVRSRGVRHGSAEVLARLARGEDVDPGEYTFRTATRIETAAPDLDWLNKGIFVGVAGRGAGTVIYEIYLVR